MRFKGGLPSTLAALALAAGCIRLVAQSQPSPIQAIPQVQEPPPLAASSISSYEGLKVEEIRLPGVAQADEAKHLRDLVAQPEAQPLDRDLIRKSVQALHATGRFADIRVEAEHTAGGGVTLSFVTEPNYFVGGITVEGNPNRPTANQLANACKLQLGELFTQEKLDRGLQNVKQLMEENGYYRYTIKEEETRHPETQQVDVLFRLGVGQRAHVGRVSITGDDRYSEAQLQDTARLHPADSVSSQRISDALQRLSKKYQKQNRWLAQVTVAERNYRPAANAVDYTIKVDPGPLVQITAEGFKISNRVLKRNIPVYQEDALDDDLLNEGRRNLMNYMQTGDTSMPRLNCAAAAPMRARSCKCSTSSTRASATNWCEWISAATNISPRNCCVRICRCSRRDDCS